MNDHCAQKAPEVIFAAAKLPAEVLQAAITKGAIDPGGWPVTVTVCWIGVAMYGAEFAVVPNKAVANGVFGSAALNNPTVIPPGTRPAPVVELPARHAL